MVEWIICAPARSLPDSISDFLRLSVQRTDALRVYQNGRAQASDNFLEKLEQALEELEGIRSIHGGIVIWGEGETLQDAIVNHGWQLYTGP